MKKKERKGKWSELMKIIREEGKRKARNKKMNDSDRQKEKKKGGDKESHKE